MSMPILSDKKIETLTLKVGADAKEVFKEVCEKEDRSISYVVRELAIRGLAQYKQDGLLKATLKEEAIIVSNSEVEKVPNKGKLSDDTKKTNKKGGKAA